MLGSRAVRRAGDWRFGRMTARSSEVTWLLRQVGLTTAAEELVPRLKQAGHPEAMPVLVEVFEAVRRTRRQGRIRRLRRASRLPPGKTFATLDTGRFAARSRSRRRCWPPGVPRDGGQRASIRSARPRVRMPTSLRAYSRHVTPPRIARRRHEQVDAHALVGNRHPQLGENDPELTARGRVEPHRRLRLGRQQRRNGPPPTRPCAGSRRSRAPGSGLGGPPWDCRGAGRSAPSATPPDPRACRRVPVGCTPSSHRPAT